MTTPKLDEARLRELAEAATPGPWAAFPYYYVTGDGERKRLVGPGPYDTVASIRMGHDDIPGSVDDNAAFIAAANPATILALLDALSAERAVSQRWHDAYSIAHDQATDNGQRLSAERERADRAVGLLLRIADDDTFDGPSSARLFFGARPESAWDHETCVCMSRDGPEGCGICNETGVRKSTHSTAQQRFVSIMSEDAERKNLATQKAEGGDT